MASIQWTRGRTRYLQMGTSDMALSEGDKSDVKEQVKLGVLEVMADEEKGIPAMVRRFITAHQETCPHGKAVAKAKVLMVGVGIGAFIAGGGSVFAVVKFLL